MNKVEIGQFEAAVASIRQEFPALRIEVLPGDEAFHALAKIPSQQDLLDFEVSINLQNSDELHLCASHLWVNWFPCGDEAVFKRFMAAVSGLLSGRFRIVESFIWGHAVKAVLQQPTSTGSWETVAWWSDTAVFFPWWRTRRVVQNRA